MAKPGDIVEYTNPYSNLLGTIAILRAPERDHAWSGDRAWAVAIVYCPQLDEMKKGLSQYARPIFMERNFKIVGHVEGFDEPQ